MGNSTYGPTSANVSGLLSAASLTSTGDTVVGDGTGAPVSLVVNGSNSGTTAGPRLLFQAAGANQFGFGTRSSLLGGAYDATPYVYNATGLPFTFGNALNVNADTTILGVNHAIFNSASLGGQIRGDGSNNLVLQGGTAGAVYVQNNAGTQNNAHFPDAGGLILDRGGAAGASYTASTGPAFASTAASGNVILQWPNGTDTSRIFSNAGNVATVASSLVGFNASTVGTVAAFDRGGNLGLNGTLYANGQVRAASDGSTQAYTPPVYNASGAALASTTHIVCGVATVTIPNGQSTGSVRVTLTGAAVFTSAPIVTLSCPYTAVPSASGNAFAIPVLNGTVANGYIPLEVLTPSGALNNSGAGFDVLVHWIAIGS